jgi:hypothetical protein
LARFATPSTAGQAAADGRHTRLVDIRVTGLREAKAAGELMAAARTNDVVDALLVLVAVPGDHLLTSDPQDLQVLAEHRGLPLKVARV